MSPPMASAVRSTAFVGHLQPPGGVVAGLLGAPCLPREGLPKGLYHLFSGDLVVRGNFLDRFQPKCMVKSRGRNDGDISNEG